jgi:metal-sulfur cluster biosynthetic enzyme
MVWMGPEGKLHIGELDPSHQDNLWGVGFFNRESKDAFIALFLEHHAEGLSALRHSGAPTLAYRWHGQLWSRGPLAVREVPAGAVLREKNVYVLLPFGAEDGPRTIESLRLQLLNPLIATAADSTTEASAKEGPGRLARPGEAGDSPIPKKVLWDALRDCKDAQLYTADVNVVDLGLVYDLRVRGDVVHIVMAMPHRGRPRLGYFTHGSISVHPTLSLPVRERLLKVPGVRDVVVEQSWEPGWSSNHLTDEGRKKLGLG